MTEKAALDLALRKALLRGAHSMSRRTHYEALADLFVYPQADYPELVKTAYSGLEGSYPEACALLNEFIKMLPDHDLRMLQEVYTRSFDVQAITTLDIGYVLFGDDYKRGQLLSHLNREHHQHDVDCGQELADHLPNVLKLIAVLEEGDLLEDMINEILAPAVHQMTAEFNDSRIRKKHQAYEKHYKTLIESPSDVPTINTLYQYPLKVLFAVLKKDFSIAETFEQTSDFLVNITKENQLEDGKNVVNKGITNGEQI